MVSKKAWIRVVEAFLSAMLVIVIIVLVVSNQHGQQQDNSAQVYGYEITVIRTIELNSTLRSEIINPSMSVPINSTNPSFPSELNSTINSNIPSSIECEAQICNQGSICNYWKSSTTSIYAQDVLISANTTYYGPRKLKLFCWRK